MTETLVACKRCGKPVSRIASVCPYCSEKLPGVARTPTLNEPTRVNKVVGPLVVIVLGVVAVWYLSGRSDELDRVTQAERSTVARQEPKPPAPALPYTVVAREDISFGTVKRLQVRVSLPHHYSRSEVLNTAKDVVSRTVESQRVNAVSILFYGPDTDTRGAYSVAKVDWAPNGRWSDADKVKAGDYSSFRYSLSYTEPAAQASSSTIVPKQAVDSSSLKPSSATGLLGVPLPIGARLVEQTPGDRATGRDPIERYAVKASASEIASFFNKAMPNAGWKKEGLSTSDALFFRKGPLMIGVLINKKGNSFTLMGS